jgi:MFS family permease
MPSAIAPADFVEEAPPIPLVAAWYGIVVLTLVTLFAGVDRQVFILLADPVSKELHLSNFDLGLLQGLGVVIFSTVATYPIAWLADRFDRRWVMSGCILVWSLSVVACGLAGSFAQLFIASAMVGAGAAGLAPIVYSLIPEIFSRQQRQMANSIYTVATTAGSGLAIALCGQVIALADAIHPGLPAPLPGWGAWRVALFLAAAPGPIFILMMLSMKIPRRSHGAMLSAKPDPAVEDLASSRIALWPYVRQNITTLVTFSVGVGLPILSFAATAVWLPLVAIRQFGATQVEVGNRLGLAVLTTAAIGWVITVYAVPLGKARFGSRLPVMVIAITAVLSGLCLVGMAFATSTNMLFTIYVAFGTFAAVGSMVYRTAMQEMAPSHLRARVVALIGIVAFVFIACGPIIVGIISDQVSARPDGLLLTIVGVGLVALVSGGLLLTLCSRYIGATIAAADAADSVAR